MATSDTADFEQERAGSRVLSSFARVLTARILQVHVDGPMISRDLEMRLGWAAKASLRVATGNLLRLGALERVEQPGERIVATELTDAGRALLNVADALEHWLSRSPFGSLALTDTAARGVIRALVSGWDSAIVRALAERPRSLAELSDELGGHSYAALKRRLANLRSSNLVAPLDDGRRSPAHAVTPWLCQAASPLVAAGRWERNHRQGELPPMTRQEIEATFLLALPLLELPAEFSGECVLAAPASTAVSDGDEAEPALAAVSVVIVGGRLASCSVGAETAPRVWALGTPDSWLEAIVAGDSDELRLRGSDPDLLAAIVDGLHEALFDQQGAAPNLRT